MVLFSLLFRADFESLNVHPRTLLQSCLLHRMFDMKHRKSSIPLVFMTIGHSMRPVAEFIRLLKAHDVQRLVDVRTIPRSRHNPQFNRDQLSAALHSARLHYRYMPGLGGFRHARLDSLNTGWKNASFRGFADYMQTTEFKNNLAALIELAKREQTAVMCAEAVHWRCHDFATVQVTLTKANATDHGLETA
jgi:uncharacterized protein (DUF488 family)